MKIKEMIPAAQCNFKIREELILHYLDTVHKYASKYSVQGICYDDLVSVGTIALIDIIDGLGYDKKNPMSMIIQAIDKAMEVYVKRENKFYDSISSLDTTIDIPSYEFDDASDAILNNELAKRFREDTSILYGCLINSGRFLEKCIRNTVIRHIISNHCIGQSIADMVMVGIDVDGSLISLIT